MNSRQVFALASTLCVVLAIVICIPYMMPANSAMPYVPNTDLKAKAIESIGWYNENLNTEILNFGGNGRCFEYSYNGNTVFLEESAAVGATHTELLVRFSDNTRGLSFEKETEYSRFLENAYETSIGGHTIYYSAAEGSVCARFNVGDYLYYVLFTGEIGEWEKTLENFLS